MEGEGGVFGAVSTVIVQSEPTLGLDVLWALAGAPMGCGIQQEALEPRFGSRGESCGVCDLCPLVWVHVNVSWRGAQIGQHPDIPAAGAVSQGAYPRRWCLAQGGVWFLLHHVLTGHPSPAGLTHETVAMRLWWAARSLALLESMWLWEPAVDAAVSCPAGTACPVLGHGCVLHLPGQGKHGGRKVITRQ